MRTGVGVYFLLLCGLFVAGCGTMSRVPEQVATLQATNVCCYDYSEIEYRPIGFGEKLRLNVGPGFPAYDFEYGKSYFVALQIPARQNVYMLEITTFLQTEPMYASYFFEPMLVLLDDEFRPLKESLGMELELRQPFFGGERWVGSVPIDPGLRHVAIYTDSSWAGKGVDRGTGPTYAPIPGGMVYAGEEGRGTAERGIDGKLHIRLIP